MTVKAYKNHRPGSRKGRVHLTFNTKGQDAAFAQGRSLKLKASTLTQWMRTWKADRKKGKTVTRSGRRSGKSNEAHASM